MPTVLKNDIHNNVAQMIYSSILSRTTRAYFFLGKVDQWSSGDSFPETPNASRGYEAETRANIIGMKYITISDVSFAISRISWSSGTVYDMYDDRYSSEFPAPSGAQDIADAKMIVITDDFNIYKCISNNYNQPSTVPPSGTDTGYLSTPDGYVWKYMATLDQIQRSKFLTPDFIPVSNTTGGRYQSGIATPVQISGGSNYSSENLQVNVLGDASRSASVTPRVVDGVITELIVDDPGEGYTTADVHFHIPFPSSTVYSVGSGADYVIEIDSGEFVSSGVSSAAVDGEISFIYVNDSGSGYSSENTTVTINGDGDGTAQATPVIVNGEVVGITLTDRGSGYTFSSVSIVDSTGQGNGAQADVIISPVGGHGKDLVKESFANTIVFHTTTSDEVNQEFVIDNDYRQAGIIFNPETYSGDGSSRSIFYENYGSACHRVNIPTANLGSGVNLSSFSIDQKIYNQTTGDYLLVIAKEVYEEAGVGVGVSLLLQSIDGSIPETGDTFRTEAGNNLFTIPAGSSYIINPTIDKFSGSMVFINNRTPFRKNIEQIVNLRTFIEF